MNEFADAMAWGSDGRREKLLSDDVGRFFG